MNDNESTEYGLMVSFVDQSSSFVNGFEAGIIWNRLQTEVEPFEMNIHTENTEVVVRMAMALKWKIDKLAPIMEGWSSIVLSKAPNNHRPSLRVIG